MQSWHVISGVPEYKLPDYIKTEKCRVLCVKHSRNKPWHDNQRYQGKSRTGKYKGRANSMF